MTMFLEIFRTSIECVNLKLQFTVNLLASKFEVHSYSVGANALKTLFNIVEAPFK